MKLNQYIGLLLAASMLLSLGCATKKVKDSPADSGDIKEISPRCGQGL